MKITLVVMLGAFEHQVLEQMREARPTRYFILRADVIPDIHRDDRNAMILVDQHVEAVRERVLREGNVHQATSARSRRRSAPPRRRPVAESIPAATTPVEMPLAGRIRSTCPRAPRAASTDGGSVASASSTPGSAWGSSNELT